MTSFNKVKDWFISMGSPPFLYKWIMKYLPFMISLSLLLVFISLSWGLFFAPTDYKQGDAYRIIYIHVPSAILSQSIFILMAITGGICLIWRAKVAGMLLRSAAPIGASFTLMALISGAIWGKPTWGTWWVWDARLTSTLILFFIYAAIVGIYSSIEDKTKGDRAAALLSLVGVSMIPIIKKSVDWWQTLHQPSTFTLTQSPSMPPEMYLPLLANVLGFYFLFIALLFLRLRTELALREQRKNWFKQKILGD